MLEKFRKALNKGGDYTALLTDMSKTFDCIPHDSVIAKLHAYVFDIPSLKLTISYLTNRHQRVKINNSCSLWKLIKHGFPQRSVSKTVLFNIFYCHLFL